LETWYQALADPLVRLTNLSQPVVFDNYEAMIEVFGTPLKFMGIRRTKYLSPVRTSFSPQYFGNKMTSN